MIRVFFSFAFLVATSQAADCQSKQLRSLGCICSSVGSKTNVRCHTTDWNSETFEKAVALLKKVNISDLVITGEWKFDDRNSKIDQEEKEKSSMQSFCELKVENFILKDFVYAGKPPAGCDFHAIAFYNSTVDYDAFFNVVAETPSIVEMSFLRHNHFAGLRKVVQLRTVNIFNSTNFDASELGPLKNLVELQVFLTEIHPSELNEDLLPSNPSRLTTIRIQACNITSINKNFISQVPHLKTLDLSHNEVVEISPETLRNFNGTIALEGNPLNCQKMLWLKKRAENRTLIVTNGDRTACAEPSGTFFMEPRKINLNVDVEKPRSSTFISFLPYLGVLVGFAVFYRICLRSRKRNVPYI